MPNAAWPLLLVFVFLVIVTAVLKTDLLSYVSAVCIIFAFMVVLHHYAALGVMGDALQVQNPYLRYFLFRSAVTVGGVAPLSLLARISHQDLKRAGDHHPVYECLAR